MWRSLGRARKGEREEEREGQMVVKGLSVREVVKDDHPTNGMYQKQCSGGPLGIGVLVCRNGATRFRWERGGIQVWAGPQGPSLGGGGGGNSREWRRGTRARDRVGMQPHAGGGGLEGFPPRCLRPTSYECSEMQGKG